MTKEDKRGAQDPRKQWLRLLTEDGDVEPHPGPGGGGGDRGRRSGRKGGELNLVTINVQSARHVWTCYNY